MTSFDLDRIHSARVKALLRNEDSSVDEIVSQLFVGQKVFETINTPKLILEGYRLQKILAILPFTRSLYVKVCQRCVADERARSELIRLMSDGLVIPVLISGYKHYPDSFVQALRERDHVSRYEMDAYEMLRTFQLTDEPQRICHGCFRRRGQELEPLFKGLRGAPELRRSLARAFNEIIGPLKQDAAVFDRLKDLLLSKDVSGARQLVDLSIALASVRHAQVWNSDIPMSVYDLERIPQDVIGETTHNSSAELRGVVADGLGLRLPPNLPLDQYVELLDTFRPALLSALDGVIKSAHAKGNGLDALLREISRLNSEIDRIKSTKRHMLVEAIAGHVRDNKAVVTATVVAGALGIGGSLVGCATGVAAGATIKVAGKTDRARRLFAKFAEANKPATRLGLRLREDVQPYVDKMMASYFNADLPAVRLLAIRTRLARSAEAPTIGTPTKGAGARGR